MDYEKAIDYILTRLRQELPSKLKYHSPEHTLSVIEAARQLGELHGISDQELGLLLTAAAYHDSGFLTGYKNHEEESCKIAGEFLPGFGFENDHIEIIKGMIRATRIPQKPETLLEKIICDADLEYLGGDNYDSISSRLHEELSLNGIELDEDEWLDMQIGFLESHNYWTEFSLNRLSTKKTNVLERLKSRRAS